MPIYLYWGEDDFAIHKAVTKLRDRLLDRDWISFNYTQYTPDQPDAIIQGLNQVMTPAFGSGKRLVWLVNTTLCQQCSEDLLSQLQSTLPVIPEASVLLLTCRTKPDGRLKSTQLLQKKAEIKEFSLIPPWKTEQLVQQVQQAAQEVGVKLTPKSAELLAQSIGNNTRQLYSELEKLHTFAGATNKPIDVDCVTALVQANTENSLQLAAAIKAGNTAKALGLVSQLLNLNEPALKIVATLVGQFRTWLWVKILMETERDETIAQAAEIGNPKRVYFLLQEVKAHSQKQFVSALPLLLELEVSLKQGAEEMSALQTKVIQLCQVFQ